MKARRELMEKFRFVFAVTGALALGGVAMGAAQAGVPGAADAIAAAAENGAIIEQVQFRWGGYNYCWYDDGWQGPGWYWCGYAYRVGLGWGGPVGWNNWRRDRDDFRERREFRDRDDFREHSEFRDRDDRRDRDHDRHDRR
jgi:hypothetical protein